MSLTDNPAPELPSKLRHVEKKTFTADEVSGMIADAVSAAVVAHSNGDDPREAAHTAITEGTT